MADKKKPLATRKEINSFIALVSSEIQSLDSVDDIVSEDPVKVAIEVMARKLAREKLKKILEPLTEVQGSKKFNKDEYSMME